MPAIQELGRQGLQATKIKRSTPYGASAVGEMYVQAAQKAVAEGPRDLRQMEHRSDMAQLSHAYSRGLYQARRPEAMVEFLRGVVSRSTHSSVGVKEQQDALIGVEQSLQGISYFSMAHPTIGEKTLSNKQSSTHSR